MDWFLAGPVDSRKAFILNGKQTVTSLLFLRAHALPCLESCVRPCGGNVCTNISVDLG